MTSTVYPTGTTIYNPEQCWNGYTLFPATLSEGKLAGAVLIDMNGNVVNQWEGLDGLGDNVGRLLAALDGFGMMWYGW